MPRATTTPSTPTEHLVQYESLGAMLGAIDATRTGTTWTRYGGENDTLDCAWGGLEHLASAVANARTGRPELAARIDTLATALADTLPMPQSIRRVPTWGRAGHTVSLGKVMAGNLQSCWRTTTRQHTPHAGRIMTLLTPVCYSVDIHNEQIIWTTAASMAYALLAERAGYRVEIWGICGAQRSFATRADTMILCRLKSAAQPWETNTLAVAIHPTFLRRLCLRVVESLQPTVGRLTSGYGLPYPPALIRERTARWAGTGGIHPESLSYGATQEDRIVNQRTAQGWLAATLATLAA